MNPLIPLAALGALLASRDSDSEKPKKDKKKSVKKQVKQIVDESKDIIDGKRTAYSHDKADTHEAKSKVVKPAPKPAPSPTPNDDISADIMRLVEQVDAANTAPKPAPKPAPMPPAPAPAPPKPPAANLVRVTVLNAQKAINAYGAAQGAQRAENYPLKLDGLFGPKTKSAWEECATREKQPTTFTRADGTHVDVHPATLAALHAGAARVTPKPAPAPKPAPKPAPAPAPKPSPTPSLIPAGYDPEGARKMAKGLAQHLNRAGRSGYDRRLLATFQTKAGIAPDKIYGGATHGALLYYGGSTAPPPFYEPLETVPYVPPEER